MLHKILYNECGAPSGIFSDVQIQSDRELQFSWCSDIGQSFAPIGLHKTDAASDWLLIKQHNIGKKGLLGVELQN
jgi:hypothetical protein